MSGGQYTKQLCVKSSGLYSENGTIPELIFWQKFMWSCTLLKVMHPLSYEITESIEVPQSVQHRMGLLWGSANGERPLHAEVRSLGSLYQVYRKLRVCSL